MSNVEAASDSMPQPAATAAPASTKPRHWPRTVAISGLVLLLIAWALRNVVFGTPVLFRLLRQVNRDSATSFLIVTHDPRLAQRCDRIIELVDGRIADDRANQV
jgi:ABC-type antimicrobial peptide transport system ATPase subunit